MSKNVVFIPNIKGKHWKDKVTTSYDLGAKSWEYWCEKNDTIFIEWKEPVLDPSIFPIIYQRDWVFDILDHNDIDYDQVLIVDADTIVHPDCPNFFNETNHKLSGVVENGCYEWVMRSINGWGHHLDFPKEIYPKTWTYFNTGFIIANKKHKPFFKELQDFYLNNIDKINHITKNETYKNLSVVSTGQTIVNFLLNKYNIERTILPECYNFNDFFRKNLLHIPNNSWWSDELSFIQGGWVYHFAAMPDGLKNLPTGPRHLDYWMERTFKHFYDKK